MKLCSKCSTEKAADSFYPDSSKKDGRHSICKLCVKADRKQHYDADPKKYNAMSSRYAADPVNRFRATLRRYNLTQERYDRMLAEQDNRCAACGDVLELLSGRQIHIDHDHSCCPANKSCGECVRGILCAYCNSALGMLRDEAWRVDALGWYLLRTQRVA